MRRAGIVASLLAACALAGCDPAAMRREAAERRAAQEREMAEHRAAQAREAAARAAAHRREIEAIYSSSQGIAKYEIPNVTISIVKQELTLDLWEQMKNAAKAVEFTMPVSQAYYDKVKPGDRLSEVGNVGGLIFEGEISSYVASIKEKGHSSMYCAIRGDQCSPISEQAFNELRSLDAKTGDYAPRGANLWLRKGASFDARPFYDTCDVRIESRKDNFTLDITKHLSNDLARMDHDIQVPRFICEEMRVGQTIDQRMVGASLFFSKSLSQVTFTVKDLQKNYR